MALGKIIVMLGAPGSGKGTQAKQLQDKFSIPQISTGDILRALAKEDAPLSKQIRETQAAGKLVSDDILLEVVNQRTKKEDCKNGFILDGYPRTIVQAGQLEGLVTEQNRELKVINIEILDDLLLKRLTGRRSCSFCAEIYNVYFKPSKSDNLCDKCGRNLIHRSDDNAESIEKRLQEYHKNTAPLIKYYNDKNCLSTVDGAKPAEEVFDLICNIFQ
ncbi:MAG: adenylate kinase [Acidobacteria bacterium]|nr:adenylate kinase [Acidobacteriota bacterium]